MINNVLRKANFVAPGAAPGATRLKPCLMMLGRLNTMISILWQQLSNSNSKFKIFYSKFKLKIFIYTRSIHGIYIHKS